MFVVIFLTSLLTILVLIVTSITYLVTLIYDTSGDGSSSDSLTVDAQLFYDSPGVSPKANYQRCDRPDHHHHHHSSEVNERDYFINAIKNGTDFHPIYGNMDMFSEQRLAPISKKLVSNLREKGNEHQTIKQVNQINDATSSSKKETKNDARKLEQLFNEFDRKDMKYGGTGLHWCTTKRTVDELIKSGIPIETLNSRHETALHVAVRRRKLQVLIGLLCHGANVECKNLYGETPLLVACKVNDVYACQLLIVFDADVNITDSKGYSARHYASSICSQHMKKNQLPGSAHLILATLHEMEAKRCQKNAEINESPNIDKLCTDGCSVEGTYNGNSYDRWPKHEKESLYKRHIFDDIIEGILNKKDKSNVTKQSRILCIDGGGMRGVIVCQTMIELEKYLKRPLIDYFDWIGGTSVGAFLSCALCTGTTLNQLRRICFDVKDQVFNGNKPYNSIFLERVLKKTYGSSTRMSKVKDKKLAITTVIADRDPCQLIFFRNYGSPKSILKNYGYSPDKYNNISSHSSVVRQNSPSPKNSVKASLKSNQEKKLQSDISLDEQEQNPLIWQAVRASAAAPFFFKPYGPYLDGGIISNNPTMDIMTEFYNHERVKDFLRKRREKSKETIEPPRNLELVVSFGTGRGKVVGRQATLDVSSLSTSLTTMFSPIELVRSIRAIRDLFRKVMQQSCQTEDHIIDRAQAWCSSLRIPYYRINPSLASLFSIDDKRDEQLISALWQTKLYMRSVREQLIKLAKILDDEDV